MSLPLLKMPRAKMHAQAGEGTGCLICGKPLGELQVRVAFHAEMTTDGRLIPVGHEESDGELSQGSFPLGSECLKKVPEGYRSRRGG